ncbi:MAG: Amuc_1100 family pilus-like protein [Verrucomicrobiota bacterium]|nr:Amuc_1100 family pilus-like protein [Verrucomicrobiota bacterium]
MTFIKKNLIFFIVVLITLLVSIFLIFKILTAADDTVKYKKMVRNQQEISKKITSTKILPTRKNLDIARENKRLVKENIDHLGIWLEEKYNLPNEVVPGLDCSRRLKRDCIDLAQKLRKNNVDFSPEKLFAFEDITNSQSIPSKKLVIMVLKQLKVIAEFVNMLSKAKINSISDISWEKGRTLIDNGIFKYMPIEISFNASCESTRKFLNIIQDSKYFFIIRKISFNNKQENYSSAMSNEISFGAKYIEEQKLETNRKNPLRNPYNTKNQQNKIVPKTTRKQRDLTKNERKIIYKNVLSTIINLDLVQFEITKKEKEK